MIRIGENTFKLKKYGKFRRDLLDKAKMKNQR